jgi:hypothetical protein
MRSARCATLLALCSLILGACSSATPVAAPAQVATAALGVSNTSTVVGTGSASDPTRSIRTATHPKHKAAERPTTTTATTESAASWKNVLSDNFNKGKVPGHYFQYDGPYGSGPKNCATPSHVYVRGGQLRLLMRHESGGRCGAGWYTGGVMVSDAKGGVDQRITVRFRVARHGASSHFIIPMRWPTKAAWPTAGEEDFCETDTVNGCFSFLHYSSSNQQVYREYKVNLAKWHTFRFQRVDHVVKVYIDDMTKPVWTYNGSSTTLPDTFKRVVLQQECQSSCPSGTSGFEVILIQYLKIDTRG